MHQVVQFLLQLFHLDYEVGTAQLTIFQLLFLSLGVKRICKVKRLSYNTIISLVFLNYFQTMSTYG